MNTIGKAFRFGDNIDTDLIIPARYLNTTEPKELAKYCMQDVDENFTDKIKQGDIIVAGNNFGCGSSREHAPIAIKAAGISCVIAKSYARIFYRNSFNIGLPILESKEASEKINQEDEIEVDFSEGIIKNITKKEEYQADKFPDFIQNIIKHEGLVGYVKNKLKQGVKK
ncbi:MAG: 3-isopropylmalate dehydratase small subunit [Eubacteriales bacterium]